MEYIPHYDFRDVLWAPARALQAKRIFAATFFLLIGIAIYDIFVYIALAIEGEPLGLVYDAYGLLPFVHLSFDGLIARTVYIAGIALGVLSAMIGMFAVSAIETEYIRGNRFFSALQSVRFAFKRTGQILVTELAIIAFVVLVVVLFALFGLLTRIPFIGEWLFALFLVFPGFFIAIFTVFILFVLTLSIFLLPAVAAAEREGEAFTSILEMFSTVIRQPVRWLLFTAYAVVAAKVCSFIYAYFAYRAVQFIEWAVLIGGGKKLDRLIESGMTHLPLNSDVARETFNIFPGIDFGLNPPEWARGGGQEAVGYLIAFMIFIIFASVVGYTLSVIATAQTRTYMVIRLHKDARRLSDEDPMFFTPEHVNAPLSPDQMEPPLTSSDRE